MIIEYTLFGLTEHEIELLKADLQFMKADMQNQFAKKLANIRKDRGLWGRVGRELAKKTGMNIMTEYLITRVEIMNQLDIISWSVEKLDFDTIKATIKISDYLDMMKSMDIPLLKHFESTKSMMKKLEKEIKKNYTKKLDIKIIEEKTKNKEVINSGIDKK